MQDFFHQQYVGLLEGKLGNHHGTNPPDFFWGISRWISPLLRLPLRSNEITLFRGQTSHTKHGQNKSACEKSIHLQEETFFLEMIPRDNVFQLRRSNIVQFRKSTTARNYQPFPKRTHASTPSVLIYTWQVVLDFNHQQYYLGYFIVFGVSLGLDLLVR